MPVDSNPLGAAIAESVGRRAEQQDAGRLAAVPLASGRQGLLMIVADGMGGHAGGSVASRTAIEAFLDAFTSSPRAATAKRLREGLDAANAAIAQRAKADPSLAGMGCTLVATVLDGATLTWISVGDTLLLAADGRRLRRLNADHSYGGLLDESAARGEITVEEAQNHEQRHYLRAALTGERIALIDEGEGILAAGAIVVAATDGVLTLPPEDLASFVGQPHPPHIIVRAVVDAIERMMPDDQDNITVAAVRVSAKAAQAAGAARRRKRGGRWRLLVAILAILVVMGGLTVLAVALWPQKPPPPPPAPAEPALKPAAPAVEAPATPPPETPPASAAETAPTAPAPAPAATPPPVREVEAGELRRLGPPIKPKAPARKPAAKPAAKPPAKRPPAKKAEEPAPSARVPAGQDAIDSLLQKQQQPDPPPF